MNKKTIDGKMLKTMFLAGAKSLEAKKEWINELNVFPVPDGDTGTNMTLTIMSAAKEVNQTEDGASIEAICKAISSGSLRGARGNSGVILSQLFRGFTKEIKHMDEIDANALANACKRATETAYKAVMKPKEGTILTVAKGMSDKALEVAETTDDLEVLIGEVIKEGDFVLSQTPEMLPVLKQAGVVDSGGQGLMQVLKGCFDAFLGKEIDLSFESVQPKQAQGTDQQESAADIKFGYCTEFIVMLDKPFNAVKENEFKTYLESIGDSIVVVADDDIVKVHVHTNDPGLAIQKGLSYGALNNMKIDNMREEHKEKVIKEADRKAAQAEIPPMPHKENGFVAVSTGDGICEIFKGLGVDYVIEGGQTMNPSTEDVLKAVSMVNADHVFVFPNNKNIILAANQAKQLVEDKEIIVIPSKTVPQGIAALINYVQEASVEENTEHMKEGMESVKTGEVTYAVRDTMIDGKEIKQDDIMGIGDDGILAVGKEIAQTTMEMIDAMTDEDSELISIYYGKDVKEADANEIADQVAEKYPDVDVEINYGGQPIYYYMISVE